MANLELSKRAKAGQPTGKGHTHVKRQEHVNPMAATTRCYDSRYIQQWYELVASMQGYKLVLVESL